MLNMYPDVLTVRELREILYIGRNKAYEILESGTIKGFKLGNAWRVSKQDLLRYLRAPEG